MNGRDLTLGFVAGLAVAGVLSRRGSRAMVMPDQIEKGLVVSVEEIPAYQWRPDYRDLDQIRVIISPEAGRWWRRGEIGGHIVLLRTRWNLWEVDTIEASKGYGPLLYDLAMELAHFDGAYGVVPDRSGISEAAERVWERYKDDTRPDVSSDALPWDYPDRDKHTLRHRPHLDLAYRKSGTPLLDALRRSGRFHVHGTRTPLTQSLSRAA